MLFLAHQLGHTVTALADVVTPPTPPEEGKFGGAMGGYTRTQKRKNLKALIADDEEFMNMVAQALPELIAKIFKI